MGRGSQFLLVIIGLGLGLHLSPLWAATQATNNISQVSDTAATNWEDDLAVDSSSDASIAALRQAVQQTSGQSSNEIALRQSSKAQLGTVFQGYGFPIMMFYLLGITLMILVLHLNLRTKTWQPEWIVLGAFFWWGIWPFLLIYLLGFKKPTEL